jgi:hypothetical protein
MPLQGSYIVLNEQKLYTTKSDEFACFKTQVELLDSSPEKMISAMVTHRDSGTKVVCNLSLGE